MRFVASASASRCSAFLRFQKERELLLLSVNEYRRTNERETNQRKVFEKKTSRVPTRERERERERSSNGALSLSSSSFSFPAVVPFFSAIESKKKIQIVVAFVVVLGFIVIAVVSVRRENVTLGQFYRYLRLYSSPDDAKDDDDKDETERERCREKHSNSKNDDACEPSVSANLAAKSASSLLFAPPLRIKGVPPDDDGGGAIFFTRVSKERETETLLRFLERFFFFFCPFRVSKKRS